jgi:thiol-disulfide isomerase/thioredoxin
VPIAFRYDSHSVARPGHTGERGIGFCHNAQTLNVHRSNPLKNKESAMASELIKHVSDASFEADVLKAGTPVLVDYWAEWCGPCKMIAPILDEVAGTYQGKLQIAKMNVDENREFLPSSASAASPR